MATSDLVDRNLELKPFLGIKVEDEGKDDVLDILNDVARSLIEDYLDRLVVSRGAITEFHTVWGAVSEIFMTQYPVIGITTIHEDEARVFGAASLLTENTDYIVNKPFGKVIRIDSNLQSTWLTGWRAIKCVYTAGFANTAGVDATIKHAALRTVALMYGELERREIGYSSISDAAGNVSRLVPGGLNQDVKRALYAHRRMEQNPTGETDV